MKKRKQKPTIGSYHTLLVLAVVVIGLFLAVANIDQVSSFLTFAQKQIKLNTFEPPNTKVNNTVALQWLKECKPAIYLYPLKEQAIAVTVKPDGYFTKTIPTYPAEGWHVIARPNGDLTTQEGTTFPYLYYESALKRSSVVKPSEGFVVVASSLSSLFDRVLPSLGFNNKERTDFKNYWLSVLPQSPYYFVGLLPVEAINQLEALQVSPKPDSILRVRFYFEPLAEPKTVIAPTLTQQARSGFSVVEWGGIVDYGKKDFVCSQ